MRAVQHAHLSPKEISRRLGVSPKALRLYEQRGLVNPIRTENGWRAYGPEELVALHKIMALKAMGLSLTRIAELLRKKKVALDSVLAAQEEALTCEQHRAEKALKLVRAARARIAGGTTLSIDDLATLTTETTMTKKPTREEWKEIFDPLIEKHFKPGVPAELTQRHFDQEAVTRDWNALFEEARILMAKGDPASPEALSLARRWRALVEQFTGGNPILEQNARNVWNDAMADKDKAAKLPVSPEMFAFVGKAMANLPKG